VVCPQAQGQVKRLLDAIPIATGDDNAGRHVQLRIGGAADIDHRLVKRARHTAEGLVSGGIRPMQGDEQSLTGSGIPQQPYQSVRVGPSPVREKGERDTPVLNRMNDLDKSRVQSCLAPCEFELVGVGSQARDQVAPLYPIQRG